MTETAQQEEPVCSCPRCGAELGADQDWCLECGAAATTRVIAPPGWRLPLAVVLGVVLVFGVVLAIALTALSHDADRAVPAAPASASATATGAKGRPNEPAAKTSRPAGATGSSGASGATDTQGGVPLWPNAKDAYSVILLTTTDRDGAIKMARELNAKGGEAGILSSTDFEFFGPGQWIVWSGNYQDKAGAVKAAATLAKDGRNGYVTLVKHKS